MLDWSSIYKDGKKTAKCTKQDFVSLVNGFAVEVKIKIGKCDSVKSGEMVTLLCAGSELCCSVKEYRLLRERRNELEYSLFVKWCIDNTDKGVRK
jgi:hypothetical protein